jgi:hypothetical protein
MRPLEMLGKNIRAVLGAAVAKAFMEKSGQALKENASVSYLRREKTAEGKKIFQVNHIPLREIPDPYSPEIRTGTLVVEQDITRAIMERMRHEKTLRSLVEALTALVDRRVPFFANH